MALIYEKRELVLNFKENKPTVYRIAPVRPQQVTFDKLLNEVSNSCGVNRAQAKATVEALLDRMTLFMDYGMSVKLGDFGSFKPTIKVKSQENVEDLGSDNVVRRKILFSPGKRFKAMLNDLSIATMGESTNVVSNDNSPGSDDGGNTGGGGNDWEDPSA